MVRIQKGRTDEQVGTQDKRSLDSLSRQAAPNESSRSVKRGVDRSSRLLTEKSRYHLWRDSFTAIVQIQLRTRTPTFHCARSVHIETRAAPRNTPPKFPPIDSLGRCFLTQSLPCVAAHGALQIIPGIFTAAWLENSARLLRTQVPPSSEEALSMHRLQSGLNLGAH